MSIIGATAWAVVSAVTTIASMAYQQVAARKQRKKQKEAERDAAEKADAAKGLQVPVEAAVVNISVVYGRAKVGGLRTFHKVSMGYIYVAPTPGTIVFTSGGAQSDPVQPLTSVLASKIEYSAFSQDGTTYQENPNPYVYGVATSGLTSLVTSPITATSGTLLVNTAINYTGPNTYTIAVPVGELSRFVVGQTLTITHKAMQSTGGIPSTTDVRLTYQITVKGLDGVLTLVGYDLYASSGENFYGALTLGSTTTWGGYNPALSTSTWGERNEALFFRQVLCYEGINDVLHVIVGNNESIYLPKWNTRVHVHKMGGGGCNLVNATFPEEASSHYPMVAHATGLAWLNRDDPQFSGVPELSFIVEGETVYDIIKTGDVFALGSKIYSNSPPLVLLDYLLNQEYGKSLSIGEIDLESFYWAHKYSARLVQVAGSGFYPPAAGDYWEIKARRGIQHTVSLYEANIAVDTSLTVRENIENILDCMGETELIWADGKYRLSIAYPQEYKATFDSTSLGPITGGVCTPGTAAYYSTGDVVQYPPGVAADVDLYMSMVDYNSNPPLDNGGNLNYGWTRGPGQRLVAAYLTDDDIILGTDLSQSWTSANDKLNFHTTRFLNEAKGFQEDSASWPPKYNAANPVYSTYLSEDRGIPLEAESFQKGITDYYHALANSESIVRSSRYSATLICSISRKSIFLEPGDFIKINSEILSIPGELYRVLSTKVDDKGDVAIECSKFDARNLAWNAKDDEVVIQRNVYSDALRQATNLQFNPTTSIGIESGGTLTWTPSPDFRVTQYQIKLTYQLIHQVIPGSTSWTYLGTAIGNSFVLPAMVAQPMTATVVAMDANGRTAPEYDIRTGSRWPLVSLIPVDAFLPLMATLTNSSIMVPDGGGGSPDLTNAFGDFRLSRGYNLYSESAVFSVESTDGITVTISNTTGTKGHYVVTAMTTTAGRATLVATLEGSVFRRDLNVFYSGTAFGGNVEEGITPAPPSFTLESGITFYSVEHPFPTFTVNGGYQATRIYAAEKLPGASTNPDFTMAHKVHDGTGPMFYINSNPATEWFVWVSWVAENGIESVKIGPQSITTGQDVQRLLTALAGKIGNSEISVALDGRIDAVEAGVATNTSDIALIDSSIATLTADVGAAQLTIQQESQLRSDADASLVAAINTLQIDVPGMTASLQQEAILRAEADDDLFAQWTVKTDLNGYVSGFGYAATTNNGVPSSIFKFNVDTLAVGAPGAGFESEPIFVIQTGPTIWEGQNVPAGVYLKEAFIKNGTITSAKIGYAAVDSANIKDLAVDTVKIKGNAITIPVYFYAPGGTPIITGVNNGTYWQLVASNTLMLTPGASALIFVSVIPENITGGSHTIVMKLTGDVGNGEYDIETVISGKPNNTSGQLITWFSQDTSLAIATEQAVTYRVYGYAMGDVDGWAFRERRMSVMGAKK